MSNLYNYLGYSAQSYMPIMIELQELYMSPFLWENLPDTVDERFIEWSLMMHNQAVFYKQERLDDFICLRSAPVSKPDIYGRPVLVEVWGMNGFKERLDLRDQGVIIFDNKSRYKPLRRLQSFAKRIDNMELTADINIYQQRTPRVWTANSDTENSLAIVLDKIRRYNTDIVVDDSIATRDGKSSVLNAVLAPAPFVADKIRIEKKQLYSEILAYMGIESNSSEKKERLTSDEVDVSNGQADSKLATRLRERRIAVEKINEKYGLDIKVEINVDAIKEARQRLANMLEVEEVTEE